MNRPAEDVTDSTNLMSGDPADAIADILMDDAKEDEETVDSTEEETLTEESTDSDESDETETEEESEEETSLEDVANDDPTWEDVLGIEENKLAFDDDGNLTGINVKVNGESSTVALSEVVAGYQLNKSITQKSQALSEERKTFEQEREVKTQEFTSKLNEVAALNSYMEQQLLGEYNNVDWQNLRIANPAEYSALRQDFATRAQEIQNVKETTANTIQQQQQQAAEAVQAQQKALLKEQWDKVIEKNPTWADEATFTKEMDSMKTFLSDSYGFTADDFKFVTDSRLFDLIKDARKFREGAKLAKEKTKRTVPQFQKSVGKGVKKPTKLAKLTKAAKNAKGAQKRELQSEAVAELLIKS